MCSLLSKVNQMVRTIIILFPHYIITLNCQRLQHLECRVDVVGRQKCCLHSCPLSDLSFCSLFSLIQMINRRSITTPTTVWRSQSTAAPTSTTASSAPHVQVTTHTPTPPVPVRGRFITFPYNLINPHFAAVACTERILVCDKQK